MTSLTSSQSPGPRCVSLSPVIMLASFVLLPSSLYLLSLDLIKWLVLLPRKNAQDRVKIPRKRARRRHVNGEFFCVQFSNECVAEKNVFKPSFDAEKRAAFNDVFLEK